MIKFACNLGIRSQLVVILISFLLFAPGQGMRAGNTGTTNDAPPSPEPQKSPRIVGLGKRVFVAGDAVLISTFPDTTSFLNNTFPIDDRGYVELPIIGKVKINQMTEQEFIAFLQDQFKNYLRFPYLRVKPMIRTSILGGVAKPGLYYFDPDNSLWELMYLAGGTTDEDGLKEMRWKRNKKTVKKNLLPFFQNGTSLKNMHFKSGDQIWVKSPGKPGFWAKVGTVLPIITLFTTTITLWVTYQRTSGGVIRP